MILLLYKLHYFIYVEKFVTSSESNGLSKEEKLVKIGSEFEILKRYKRKEIENEVFRLDIVHTDL